MQAYQLVEWQHPPQLREVEVPEPGPGEILVKVGGAGACHSDLHVLEGTPRILPRIRAPRRADGVPDDRRERLAALGRTGDRLE